MSKLLFRLHKCIFLVIWIFNMNSLKGFKKRLKWISCMLEIYSFICFRVLNIRIGLWFVMFCLRFDMGQFSANFVQPRFSSSFLKKNGLYKNRCSNSMTLQSLIPNRAVSFWKKWITSHRPWDPSLVSQRPQLTTSVVFLAPKTWHAPLLSKKSAWNRSRNV